MLFKRAKTRWLFFPQNYKLKSFFYSNWKQFQVFKIAKIEFKVTVHYNLWANVPSYDPLSVVEDKHVSWYMHEKSR